MLEELKSTRERVSEMREMLKKNEELMKKNQEMISKNRAFLSLLPSMIEDLIPQAQLKAKIGSFRVEEVVNQVSNLNIV